MGEFSQLINRDAQLLDANPNTFILVLECSISLDGSHGFKQLCAYSTLTLLSHGIVYSKVIAKYRQTVCLLNHLMQIYLKALDWLTDWLALTDLIPISCRRPQRISRTDFKSKKPDLARVTFDLEADLSPLFNWNTKLLFVSVLAEFSNDKYVRTWMDGWMIIVAHH